MFVSAFRGSWAGGMSRDVVRGTELWSFVEFKLRCCMCMWPFLVVRDYGKYFMVRGYVGPVQDKKWPRLMARRKVNGRGLKAHPWSKAASSLFVFACLVATLAR